jgi:bifunctional DNA-binding transcriptional regulator/antitoxin component of YhaV-PrlF toxin-antitoxin module
MELRVLKNKANGQISITVPKAIADLYGIDEKTKVMLESKKKGKNEFILKIENK